MNSFRNWKAPNLFSIRKLKKSGELQTNRILKSNPASTQVVEAVYKQIERLQLPKHQVKKTVVQTNAPKILKQDRKTQADKVKEQVMNETLPRNCSL